MIDCTTSLTNIKYVINLGHIIINVSIVTDLKRILFIQVNGSQLAKMKKSIPGMSLP